MGKYIKNLEDATQSVLREGIADGLAKLLGIKEEEATNIIDSLSFSEYLELSNAVDIEDRQAAIDILDSTGPIPAQGKSNAVKQAGKEQGIDVVDLSLSEDDEYEHQSTLLCNSCGSDGYDDWGNTCVSCGGKGRLTLDGEYIDDDAFERAHGYDEVEEDNKLLDVPTPTLGELAKKHDVALADLGVQLTKGIKAELEHTSDRKIAKEIALDHLNELPDYYDRLEAVEEADNPFATPASAEVSAGDDDVSTLGATPVDDLRTGDDIEVIDIDGDPAAVTVKQPKAPGDTLIVQTDKGEEHIVKDKAVSGTPKMEGLKDMYEAAMRDERFDVVLTSDDMESKAAESVSMKDALKAAKAQLQMFHDISIQGDGNPDAIHIQKTSYRPDVNGTQMRLPEWMIKDEVTGDISYLVVRPAQLDEIAPLIGMAARAAGAAVGSKVADKVMGEDENDARGKMCPVCTGGRREGYGNDCPNCDGEGYVTEDSSGGYGVKVQRDGEWVQDETDLSHDDAVRSAAYNNLHGTPARITYPVKEKQQSRLDRTHLGKKNKRAERVEKKKKMDVDEAEGEMKGLFIPVDASSKTTRTYLPRTIRAILKDFNIGTKGKTLVSQHPHADNGVVVRMQFDMPPERKNQGTLDVSKAIYNQLRYVGYNVDSYPTWVGGGINVFVSNENPDGRTAMKIEEDDSEVSIRRIENGGEGRRAWQMRFEVGPLETMSHQDRDWQVSQALMNFRKGNRKLQRELKNRMGSWGYERLPTEEDRNGIIYIPMRNNKATESINESGFHFFVDPLAVGAVVMSSNGDIHDYYDDPEEARKEVDRLNAQYGEVEEARQGGKTEHSGAKKGKGGYYGRKKDAKADSNKNRRQADKQAVSEEPGDWDHGYNYEGPSFEPATNMCPDCEGSGQNRMKQDSALPGLNYDCERCNGEGAVFESEEFARMRELAGVNEAVAKIACTQCDEVSTAKAWNKNGDFCPKCKDSNQGVAENINEAKAGKFNSRMIGNRVKVMAQTDAFGKGDIYGKEGVVTRASREHTFSAMVPFVIEYGIRLDSGENISIRREHVRKIKETSSAGGTGAGAVAVGAVATGNIHSRNPGIYGKTTEKPKRKKRKTTKEEASDDLGRTRKE